MGALQDFFDHLLSKDSAIQSQRNETPKQGAKISYWSLGTGNSPLQAAVKDSVLGNDAESPAALEQRARMMLAAQAHLAKGKPDDYANMMNQLLSDHADHLKARHPDTSILEALPLMIKEYTTQSGNDFAGGGSVSPNASWYEVFGYPT